MGKRKRRSSSGQPALHCNVLREETNENKQRKLSVVLSAVLIVLGCGFELFTYLYYFSMQRSIRNKESAKKRKPRPRTTWADENKRISDKHFYRLFRMSRPCFNILCTRIETAVGEKEFKSEKYIQGLTELGHTTLESSMCQAAINGIGGYIPGEVKVAIALRLLAGASYLDMFLWMNIDPDYVRSIFRTVTRNWFCNDDVMKINFFDVINDDSEVSRITQAFGSRSCGIFSGTMGALDGWLVKIKCPSAWECANPGKYFCRKGFSAINVQVIVDLKKRVLWRYIGSKGSSHDSPVFHESSLGKFLEYWAVRFEASGLYLVGDSAYALRSYLLTPYDNAMPGSSEDVFNFFLSSQRIYVECAFGEIDRRWGIFWKPLQGSLTNHKYVIDSALRLHNFIVNYREEHGQVGKEHDDTDTSLLNSASYDFQMENPFETMGAFSNEDIHAYKRRGRHSNEEKKLRERGKTIRDNIRDMLARKGLARPKRSGTSSVDRFNRRIIT